MVGNDFVMEKAAKDCLCSECGKIIFAGDQCLESIKGGKVRKRVCSEECRLEFDAKFWDGVAVKNLTRMRVLR